MATKTTEKNKIASAHAYGVRVSPRKMRLVINMIKNMWVEEALAQLVFTPKRAAKHVSKLISSAIANATTNFSLKRESLYIKEITCDGGMKLKRYMPRAQGRASEIRRPTSHIHVILEERAGRRKRSNVFVPKSETSELKKTTVEADDKSVADEKSKPMRDQVTRTSEQTKANKVTQKRRLFNRKSGV
jgi:large subunit ribosomal protein L22